MEVLIYTMSVYFSQCIILTSSCPLYPLKWPISRYLDVGHAPECFYRQESCNFYLLEPFRRHKKCFLTSNHRLDLLHLRSVCSRRYWHLFYPKHRFTTFYPIQCVSLMFISILILHLLCGVA